MEGLRAGTVSPLVHRLDSPAPAQDRLATQLRAVLGVRARRGQRDAAGLQPDRADLAAGHGDYHPALGRSLIGDDVDIAIDPPSSILAGEDFLARIYGAIRSADSPEGSNAYNTTFFVGWDEPGGTGRPRSSRPGAPADPSAPAGECDFTFDRSGYRVPAIIVSPWIDEGTVINDEYRHTSLLATLRKVWDLGDPFTDRDAAARTFDHLLSREAPRDPASWPDVHSRPVPEWQLTKVELGQALSPLGKAIGPGIWSTPSRAGLPIPADIANAKEPPTGQQLVEVVFEIAAHYFPRLAEAAESATPRLDLPTLYSVARPGPRDRLRSIRPDGERAIDRDRAGSGGQGCHLGLVAAARWWACSAWWRA